MFYNNISDVNFERIWRKQIKHFSHADSAGAAKYWNRRAKTYSSPAKTSSYTNDLLKRMKLRTGYSVLDIGCGNGIMTIPIAKQVKKVTALDLSPAMLETLKEKINRAGTANINIVNKNWDEVTPGIDIEKHDIVLASRCLSGQNISDALRKIDQSAGRACYITWRAERSDKSEAEVHKLLNKEYVPHPEYTIILNVLYKLGIRANLDIFESTSEENYQSMEEAVKNLTRGEEVSDQVKGRLTGFIDNYFNHENGYYYRKSIVRWALIWWLK